ncbi:MAG: alpha,alpha-trehalose-phosphate synthase (UDP-forming) [Bauldia sp.]
MTSRLVVVSNRVPVPQSGAASGGLAVALRAALAERGGLWFGWSGKTSGDLELESPRTQVFGAITYSLVDLTKKDVEEYYNGFANSSLWPLLHYRLDLTDFSRKDMAGYFRVNRYFARMLAQQLRPDDIVWVHDYHLIPLAAELRQMGIANPLGFFLHIPWPPPDVFLALPPHEHIVRALCTYDLVGFQTAYDADNFVACMERENLGIRQVAPHLFEGWSRQFRVGVFPIGIETDEFATMAARAVRNPIVQRLRASIGSRRLIIGVDRLDYSKGITQRIEAFNRYVTNNPPARNSVTYLQVSPPSRTEVREYAEMQRQVAELAGRINGALGDVDWTPIRYVNRAISRPALAGLYRLGDVGLVTPLRDGMNLVAKEYVAAQDPQSPGVLVISRFAGAASELGSGAILVNPYDIDETAAAIHRALTMPIDERMTRWQRMYEAIQRNDVTRWCEAFLAELERAGGQHENAHRALATSH